MNELEKKLLDDVTDGTVPQVCVQSRTRIDTGRWWRQTPVWLCVTDDELLMLAVSRRRYVERVPLDDCRETHYCHTTGELVVEPGEELKFSRFRVSPREALALLDAMGMPQWDADIEEDLEPIEQT